MQLVYDSMTGNTRRFANKVAATLGLVAEPLEAADASQPFLLFTYTFGEGAVPERTAAFLELHGVRLRGVVSSGSYHWGASFARAGDMIATRWGVPCVARVNKSGSERDVLAVVDWFNAQPALLQPK